MLSLIYFVSGGFVIFIEEARKVYIAGYSN